MEFFRVSMEAQTHENFSRAELPKSSSDRSFGFIFAVVFAFLGAVPLLRGKPARLWSLSVSAIFLLLALTVPTILGPLNRLWMRVGLLISKVTNPIIASLMFFLVFTPVALFLRLLGKDLLRLKFDSGANTYWIIRRPPGPSPETMRNQF
jgi:hypothetical protein